MKTFNLFSTTVLLFCLVLLEGCPKNKFSLPIESVSNNDSFLCSNRVLATLIKPTDLQSILNTAPNKKIYLQFKTNDDHNFYVAGYAGLYPYSDVSSSFNSLAVNPPFLPAKPYILGNVEWKFPSNFQVNTSLNYYCLIPAMADDNVHVTFSYLEIPSKFQYNDTTYNVDTAFVAHSNPTRLDSLASYSIHLATGSNGATLNPIPPKKPQ